MTDFLPLILITVLFAGFFWLLRKVMKILNRLAEPDPRLDQILLRLDELERRVGIDFDKKIR